MSFRDVSELPIENLRGGDYRVGEADAGGVLHLNVVYQNANGFLDEQLLFWAGEDDHPGNGGVKRIFRGKLNPDGFNDTTRTVRAEFNGYTIIEDPVDTAVATFSSFGFPFDADSSQGARLSDFSITNYNNAGTEELRLFCIVNNHQSDGRNHLGMLISQDNGYTWVLHGEVFSPSGSNQGTPIGAVFTLNNVIYAQFGDGTGGKRDRYSTDGGVTWIDTGVNIPVSSNPYDLNHTNLPIGRGRIIGDKAFSFINNSQDHRDWPKTISMYYKNIGTLNPDGTYSGLVDRANWSKHPFPISVCGPTGGGEWQLNVVEVHGKYYALVNRWGEVGFTLINTVDMDALQDTPYYGINGTVDHPQGFGHKHVYCKSLNWDGLFDNAGNVPILDGATYTLEIGNRYLGIVSNTPSFGEQLKTYTSSADDRVKWVLNFHYDTLRISPFLNPAVGLSCPGYADTTARNARGVSVDLRNLAEGDHRTRWVPLWVGGSTPTGVVLVNMESRLELKPDGKQDVGLNQQSSVWRLRKL